MTEVHSRLATAIEKLTINHNRGPYHKPVALVWALNRAKREQPRLARSTVVRAALDPLLGELTGSGSNAAWPWLKLANDLEGMWTVDGADPSQDPPPRFVAGWSRSTHEALAADSRATAGLVDLVVDRYLDKVRNEIADVLGIAAGGPAVEDTVVVAAKVAYDEYLQYSAYICQANRSFRDIDRFAFYRAKRIEPHIPKILIRMMDVEWTEAEAARLVASANSDDHTVGELMRRVMAEPTGRDEASYQIIVLSGPDDAETIRLAAPLEHRGPSAWAQGQRYASSERMKRAESTNDL